MKKVIAFITVVLLSLMLSTTVYLYTGYPSPQDFSPLILAVKNLVKEPLRLPLIGAISFTWGIAFVLSLMVLFEGQNQNKFDEEKEAKELKELLSQLDESKNNIEILNKEISLCNEKYKTKDEECKELLADIKELKDRVSQAEVSENTKKEEAIKEKEAKIDELLAENERLDSENKRISKEAKKNESELEAMIEKVKETEEKQKQSKKEAEKAKSSLKASLIELDSLRDKLKELQSELLAKQQELESAIANSKGGSKAIPPAAFQILYLLQKEGRLIDLLMEDISEFDDETLGGAIRPIHEGCQKLLKERLIIEHVLNEEEGSEITIEKLDPEIIKLSGNVPTTGPYTGELIHRGWRLKECHLPELVDGWSGNVVAPAEIEII